MIKIEPCDVIVKRNGSVFLAIDEFHAWEISDSEGWRVLFNHDPISLLNRAGLPHFDIILVATGVHQSVREILRIVKNPSKHLRREQIKFWRDHMLDPSGTNHNKAAGSFSLDLSPADLHSFAKNQNETIDTELVRGIIKRLNAEVGKFKEDPKKAIAWNSNKIEHISVFATGKEEKRHILKAIEQLKKEGYNARYEYQEECDDGPNRSSPDYHRLILVVG